MSARLATILFGLLLFLLVLLSAFYFLFRGSLTELAEDCSFMVVPWNRMLELEGKSYPFGVEELSLEGGGVRLWDISGVLRKVNLENGVYYLLLDTRVHGQKVRLKLYLGKKQSFVDRYFMKGRVFDGTSAWTSGEVGEIVTLLKNGRQVNLELQTYISDDFSCGNDRNGTCSEWRRVTNQLKSSNVLLEEVFASTGAEVVSQLKGQVFGPVIQIHLFR